MKPQAMTTHSPLLSTAIAILMVGLMAGLASANTPTRWEPAANLSDAPGRSRLATLARNPVTGDLFVAWTDEAYGAEEEVVGRQWKRVTRSWLPGLSVPPENLSQAQWVDGGPALFFDQQGQGLLIWTRHYSAAHGAPADRTEVVWRSWSGTGWSQEAVLMSVGTYLPGNYGLIPVETPEGILLFITFNRSYRTTEYQDDTWSEPTPWIYLDVFLAQMLIDDEGLIHAAAYGQNSAQWDYNRYFYDAYYLTYDGASWSEPLNLSFTDGVAESIGMAFDRQGRLHFLWSDPDSVFSDESLRSAIYERVYDSGTWTPNAQVTEYNDAQAISEFSLTTDVNNTLHLAWNEGLVAGLSHADLDIYYQSGDGSAWDSEEKVYTSKADSRYPVLSVDSEAASLVWQEGSISEPDIFFSRKATYCYLPLIIKGDTQ